MTRDIGLLLGRQIGAVCDIDVGASGDCMGKYIRVRVKVDMTKPLMLLFWLPIVGAGVKEVCPSLTEVCVMGLHGVAGGPSPTGGESKSRCGGRWKRKAREKMTVDEGVVDVVLKGKRAGLFAPDPEDQVFKKSKCQVISMNLEESSSAEPDAPAYWSL
ncbi:hypothetical protein ACOSQ4_022336 [Xanthoceras sorbifolium]